MARVVRFHQLGGPEALRVDQLEVGAPRPGEARITVGAIGLNRVESMFRGGTFGQPRLPSRIGYEAAGVIEAIGRDVKGFEVGDQVALLPGLSMEEFGACADTVLYPADMLIKQPGNLSAEIAAAAWMQYLTAYAIVGVANTQRGEPVLITAASSSVGLAAIEIANLIGAVPIAVTRTHAKVATLIGRGARHVIVGEENNLVERVRAVTEEKGVRVVFDAVAGDTVASLVDAAAPGGIITIYGMLGGAVNSLPLSQIMLKGLSLRGYAMNEFMADATSRSRALEFVYNGLGTGKLNPVIDRIFALEDIADAYRYLESNVQVGKVIVRTR
jgi:NADPH:quinone reductase-like Zn-dependent oxidoreductase